MDTTVITSFALILLLIGGYAAFSKQLIPVWSERKAEFESIKDSWKPIIIISALVSVIVVYALTMNRELPTKAGDFFFVPEPIPLSIIAMLGLLTYVSTLSAATDFLISRAPFEPTDLLFYLGAPVMLFYGGFDDVIETTWNRVSQYGVGELLPALGEGFVTADWSGLISAGIWFLCPLILMTSVGRGIGDADFFYLVAITTTVSWWAGWYVTFMLFGLGCFIQILMYFVFQKLNMGELRKIKPSPTKLTIQRMLMNIFPSLKFDVSGKKVERYYTPLLPALGIAYVGGLVFLLLTGNSMLLINGGVGIFGT